MKRYRSGTAAALLLAASLFTGCVAQSGPTVKPSPTPTPGTTPPPGTSQPTTSENTDLEGVKRVTTSPALATYDTSWRFTNKLQDGPGVPDPVAQAIRKFSAVSFTALQAERAESGDENLLYVPLSLYIDLAMLTDATAGRTRADLDGALNQGFEITAEERQQAIKQIMLSFNKQITEGDLRSSLSNGIWLKDTLTYKPEYAKILEEVYQADSYNFSAGAEVNARKSMGEWIKEKTNGLLDESALPDDFPNPTTIMALLNALYYRSSWGSPFEEKNNTQGKFNTTDLTTVDAEFMNQTLTKSRALVRDKYQAADIVMSDLSRMRFILPNEGVDGRGLTAETDFYNDLLDLQAEDSAIVHWSVPKSDIDGKMDLLPLLENLGLGDLSKSMDLSAGLEGSGDAFLSAATQAVRIKMNEKGVEAAAVTVLGVDESTPQNPLEITMNLNRPFYAALLSPDGQVVFMAYIANVG